MGSQRTRDRGKVQRIVAHFGEHFARHELRDDVFHRACHGRLLERCRAVDHGAPNPRDAGLCVFLCLACGQVGLAEKKLAEMKGNNDDASSYRMATAAVKLATGDPEEAYLTYSDLCTQFPPGDGGDSETGSVLLQTGKALANLQRGMYTEAVEDLDRAIAKAPNDPDVLINLCACMTHLGKKEEFKQYYAKLEAAAPTHPYVMKTQSISAVFARFKASN